MKVLFAVNNEEISESIVKKYQKNYKEIISYKNVYYFNAILKEIQKDKTYDRIVISEDLEQFTNTSYEQMDKFIFEKLDSISDEASNMRERDIPIILICTERRNKSEEILVKLFGIGIYNAIIGKDRSIDEVCRLINKPRSKKEAKIYYQIDSESVSYKSENEDEVSEVEIQNILAHFKRLGSDETSYVVSYDKIAAQYNDNQLKVISRCLPLGVRAVLEEKSPKYQQVMAFNKSVSSDLRKVKGVKENDGLSEKLLVNPKRKKTIENPIIVPASMNSANNVKKLTRKTKQEPVISAEVNDIEDSLDLSSVLEQKADVSTIEEIEEIAPKRGRGRPRKNPIPVEPEETVAKRGRGRPRKSSLPEENEEIEPISLPGLEDIDEINVEPEENIRVEINDDLILPGVDEQVEKEINEHEDKLDFQQVPEEEEIYSIEEDPIMYQQPTNILRPEQHTVRPIIEHNPEPIIEQQNYNNYGYSENIHVDLSGVLQGNKKAITFVGTSKNGTSFIVNNLAEMLSSAGVNVAILDTTKNKNSYYIYTKNEENLRKTAMSSIINLSKGIASGIKVNSNFTVYTSLPNEDEEIENVQTILETLLKSHSLILIDSDFNTPKGYFSASQEVYLVQTMDILTIQPLTAFLKELVTQNILDENKIRIIINKYVKIRGVSEREIIGGMAYYNDPAMTYQTGLFDKSTVRYITIPFEEETYIKYLQGIINCEISLKGYSKVFLQNLKQLSNMIYPSIENKGNYRPPSLGNNGNGAFSASMNNTLNQMKRNY